MRWILLATFLFSIPVWSQPVVLKITNTRSHPMHLFLESEKKEFEIPAGATREIVVLQAGEWRLGYATGALKSLKWKLNFKIDEIIREFASGAEELWKDNVLRVCAFSLVYENGYRLKPESTLVTAIPGETAIELLSEYVALPGIIFPVEEGFSFADFVAKRMRQLAEVEEVAPLLVVAAEEEVQPNDADAQLPDNSGRKAWIAELQQRQATWLGL
jgi:hypothetical protein